MENNKSLASKIVDSLKKRDLWKCTVHKGNDCYHIRQKSTVYLRILDTGNVALFLNDREVVNAFGARQQFVIKRALEDYFKKDEEPSFLEQAEILMFGNIADRDGNEGGGEEG